MPYWARLMLAARWLKSSPWELMEREDRDFWIEGAGILSSAEVDASRTRSAAKKT